MTDVQAPEAVDYLVEATQVVTMNDARDVIRHGAVAVRGDTIVDKRTTQKYGLFPSPFDGR